MPTDPISSYGSPDLRRLGLIGDPFDPPPGADTLGIRLATHAESLRFISTLDSSITNGSAPVWVEKSTSVPSGYHVRALSDALAALGGSDDLDVLFAYVPLDVMARGRVRSALNAVAEHVANPRKAGRTLSGWLQHCITDFDAQLPEAALITEDARAKLLERLEADRQSVFEDYFGESVMDRDQGESTEQMMRIAGARQGRLETDEEEPAEEVTDDPMAEAFLVPTAVAEESEAKAEDELTASGLPSPDDLVEYVVAYTRAHLSPVVARGLLAFRAQGAATMAEELKVTKAPKKTFAALTRLATYGCRKTVLLYDRFDIWNLMPDDNKPAIVGALSELRWAMGENGVLGLIVPEGQAPELAEQFAAARKVVWDFDLLEPLAQQPVDLDVGLVERLLSSAALIADGAHRAISGDRIGRLIEATGKDLDRFCAAASAALHDAGDRGLDEIDDAAVEVALQRD